VDSSKEKVTWRQDGRVEGSGSVAVIVTILILLAVRSEPDEAFLGWLLVSALVVLIPLAFALFFASRCGSKSDEMWRCRRKRAGLFHRCQDHAHANLYDLLSIASGALCAFALWGTVTDLANRAN